MMNWFKKIFKKKDKEKDSFLTLSTQITDINSLYKGKVFTLKNVDKKESYPVSHSDFNGLPFSFAQQDNNDVVSNHHNDHSGLSGGFGGGDFSGSGAGGSWSDSGSSGTDYSSSDSSSYDSSSNSDF